MKLLLGIVGEKFSGKDTAADYLADKHGAFSIRQSHILDEILTTLGLPISRRNEIDLGMALRQTFGPETIGRAVEKRLLESTEELAVVQGIRFQEEFDIVKKLGGKMIYLTADPEIRYQRAMERNEKTDDQEQTYEQFLEVETTEPTEVGIPDLGGQADFTIINDRTKEELYQEIENILDQLKS